VSDARDHQNEDAEDGDGRAGRAALERLAHLQTVARNIDMMSRGVFASVSWRTGQWVALQLRRVGLRVPVSTAQTEMQRLIAELKELAELPDLDNLPKPDEVVLGQYFRISISRPRRFPAAPPARPAHWALEDGTLDTLNAEFERWKHRPLISVVVPVHDTRAKWLRELIDSYDAQLYPHRELVLVDDGSKSRETRSALTDVDARADVRVEVRAESGGISAATNQGIDVAQGEYIAFVDHDDLLEPDALLQVARAIEQTNADVIYTDEDKIDETGQDRYEPHHKPAWSPELLLAQNYISHLSVIRRALITEAGGLNSALDGSQDHDLLLRCTELANEVVHVPMALYHWRAVQGSTAREFGEKSYPWKAGRKAVEAALARRKISGTVRFGSRAGTYRVDREMVGNPLVSILIPFRDQPKLLNNCVRSILDKTACANYEIVGLDNQSTQPATVALMRELSELDPRVRFEIFDQPFNFSAINNFGAALAQGDHILLLNNDTEVISSDWLSAMLVQSQRDDVGAVGAKLLYPDDRIQHAGAILGIGGVAGHSHKYLSNDANGYFSRPHLAQNVSAVTGACLMIKRSLYTEMGGLDEKSLAVAFNDIDLCIRLRERGLVNIFEPAAVLYHHESISRGYEDSDEKKRRFAEETRFMQHAHRSMLFECDPYFNPNLDPTLERFVSR